MSGNSVTTLTLSDFLLARIAEDETGAKYVHDYDCAQLDTFQFYGADETEADYGCGRPARVLAECEAKRRIVAEHPMMPVSILPCRCSNGAADGHTDHAYDGVCRTCTASGEYGPGPNADLTPNPCATLRLLALPYADHPDYRQEWRA